MLDPCATQFVSSKREQQHLTGPWSKLPSLLDRRSTSKGGECSLNVSKESGTWKSKLEYQIYG